MRHIDLTAHLEKIRRIGQLMGNIPYGQNILGHILTHYAVTAGRAAHQLAHAVLKADRETVDFRLNYILRLYTGVAHAGIKLA